MMVGERIRFSVGELRGGLRLRYRVKIGAFVRLIIRVGKESQAVNYEEDR